MDSSLRRRQVLRRKSADMLVRLMSSAQEGTQHQQEHHQLVALIQDSRHLRLDMGDTAIKLNRQKRSNHNMVCLHNLHMALLQEWEAQCLKVASNSLHMVLKVATKHPRQVTQRQDSLAHPQE